MNECNALCCRKGTLVMNTKELHAVTRGQEVPLAKRITVNKEKKQVLALEGGCPSLVGTSCSIHTSSLRPKVCGDFPIVVTGNNVYLSNRCTAVNAGKLYPFVRELTLLGFSVAPFEQFAHLNLELLQIKRN